MRARNVEQREKGYVDIYFMGATYRVTDNNTTLKSTISLLNTGTANVEITEVYKDGILCENVTITPFSNNLVPPLVSTAIIIFQTNSFGYDYDEDTELKGIYEIVSSEGETFEFSSKKRMVHFE